MSKSLSTLRFEGSPTQSRISPSIQRILRINKSKRWTAASFWGVCQGKSRVVIGRLGLIVRVGGTCRARGSGFTTASERRGKNLKRFQDSPDSQVRNPDLTVLHARQPSCLESGLSRSICAEHYGDPGLFPATQLIGRGATPHTPSRCRARREHLDRFSALSRKPGPASGPDCVFFFFINRARSFFFFFFFINLQPLKQ